MFQIFLDCLIEVSGRRLRNKLPKRWSIIARLGFSNNDWLLSPVQMLIQHHLNTDGMEFNVQASPVLINIKTLKPDLLQHAVDLPTVLR